MDNAAAELVQDAVARITGAMKEGRFTKEDLEMIKKIFQKAIEATDRAIERGPRGNRIP